MKRRQIPDGYISSFASHTDPAIPQPPPPIVQQKQAQTLMGHCLKQFIKERLYGNMINFTRKTDNKQVKFTPFINSIQDQTLSNVRSLSSMKTQQQRRLSEVRQNIEKRMHRRFNSIVKNTDNKLEQQRGSYRHSIGDIQQSLLNQSQRQRANRSTLSNKHKMFQHQETQKSYDHQYDKYRGSSFISAIQDDSSRLSYSKNQQKKLSPIPSSNRLSHKLEKIRQKNTKSPSILPSPSRIQLEKYTISPSFWQLVCKKPKKSQQQFDTAVAGLLSKDFSNTSLQNKSMLTMVTGKSNSQLQNINAIDKSKYFLTKQKFNKDLYFEYLSNSKHVFKQLAQFLSYFFQINAKVHDDLKNQEYKQIMEVVTTAGPRVWAVMAFRFWDSDLNALIDSADIFKMFKDLDSLKTQLKQKHEDYHQLNSYKIVTSLIQTVDSLREIILEQKFQDELSKKEEKSVKKYIFQIKYLQQSILRKKDIKYSDLSLILGHSIKVQVKQTRKPVFQTRKQIGIKMSSCYRYSFLATDHNQQTRQDRQHIQTLKQSLKQQKMDLVQLENENSLINKKLPGINYTTFVQKKLYKPMKNLAYLVFGIQPL